MSGAIIGFIIGFFMGGFMGVFCMALVVAGRDEEHDNDLYRKE